jgi:hypothetical protein
MQAKKDENVFPQPGEHMAALKNKNGTKKTSGTPEDAGRSSRAKFGIFGEEMIEKEVKPSGNSARIYLPLDWVGKHVKIIRLD